MVERLNNATGALGALKYLQASTRDLDSAQGRLSSGLKVGRARDDASAFQSAALMKGQGSSLNAVTLSLQRAESISDTALSATESISKLLVEMKGVAAQAMSTDWSDEQRAAFQEQYLQQMATLQSFVQKASFDGENTLDGSKPNGVSFIADAEASQSVTLAGRNMMPGVGGIIVATPADWALTSPQSATETFERLEQSLVNVGEQLVEMGAERRRIEAQKGFVSRLADALAAGVGRMVDTDLAAESALIQALQVKQELSASAVSIANAAPQALLSLFRS